MVTPKPTGPDEPGARNTASGTVAGVVQAGVVHGDVHLHAPRPAAPVVPRQLPTAPAAFAGREAELAALDRALTTAPDDGDGAAVVITAIGGAGGIGKTWLALAWAHRNLHRFPDGQLFVDLRGFSPAERPTAPGDAVRGFLTALGVAPDRLPPNLAAQAALYRSLVAGRRVLVVLDNAATSEQVVPLLPGSPTCTVLVTGRTRPASLIDRHGARHLPLDVLAHAEAHALLTRRLGGPRVAAEPDAVDTLVGLCGRHPLALAITARHAATRPHVPLAEFADELRELGLAMLDHDTDPAASLPAVLSWSLRRLADGQRRVFALLGIAPGPDTDLPAATSLGGLPRTETRRVLHALEDASLLDRHPHGRYSMHDLVRAYAAGLADDLAGPARRAALDRVVDHHLHTGFAAARLLKPHRTSIRLDPPVAGARPHPLPDHAAALDWLDAHHAHLLAAQRTAAALERHAAVWQIAWTLHTFHQRRGHRHADLAAWRAAADVADHLPDPATRALAHRLLGRAHAALGQHEQAVLHLHEALAQAERHGNPAQRAHAHNALARVWERRGDDRRALEHARHALDLFRALDQPVWEAEACTAVGWCAARLGDHDTARDHHRAALALHRRHHDPEGEADALDGLGFTDHRTGRHDRAVDHHERALALYRSLGHTTAAAGVLDRLGHPHVALGHRERAREAWREALDLYRRQGRDGEAEDVRRRLDDLDRTGPARGDGDAGEGEAGEAPQNGRPA
ncbi:ATP-binding protein [Saccharothrix yanglingensis]|uniref:ATP-binding protein n=1 Tax=Saccharothrix yanglingensis TaxID=659496 RepID=UPI0027D27636|nr:tetratricopeptide repeat protein [Saccharothrix yanglingensis]